MDDGAHACAAASTKARSSASPLTHSHPEESAGFAVREKARISSRPGQRQGGFATNSSGGTENESDTTRLRHLFLREIYR